MTATFKEIEFFAFDRGARDLFRIMKELRPLLDKKNNLRSTENLDRLDLLDYLVSVASERIETKDTVPIEYEGLVLFLQELGGKLTYENEESGFLKKRFEEVGKRINDLGEKTTSKKLKDLASF